MDADGEMGDDFEGVGLLLDEGVSCGDPLTGADDEMEREGERVEPSVVPGDTETEADSDMDREGEGVEPSVVPRENVAVVDGAAPSQVPYLVWQPAPQYSAVSPHQPAL